MDGARPLSIPRHAPWVARVVKLTMHLPAGKRSRAVPSSKQCPTRGWPETCRWVLKAPKASVPVGGSAPVPLHTCWLPTRHHPHICVAVEIDKARLVQHHVDFVLQVPHGCVGQRLNGAAPEDLCGGYNSAPASVGEKVDLRTGDRGWGERTGMLGTSLASLASVKKLTFNLRGSLEASSRCLAAARLAALLPQASAPRRQQRWHPSVCSRCRS